MDIRMELLAATYYDSGSRNDEDYLSSGGPLESAQCSSSSHAELSGSAECCSVCKPSSLCSTWSEADVEQQRASQFSSVTTVNGDSPSTPRPVSRAQSIKLTTHALKNVTVLFIDIKGFTSACAAMPAARVGEWVADFYERVDAVAAAHGVSKIEVRGDCCVCVAGVAGRVPYRAIADAADDPRGDQAIRMLAFAAALHADLATLPSFGPAAATATRMGIASGEVAFLVSDAAAGPDAAPFASVRGDAVDGAARMEALAAAGEALVHKTAAHRWAAEGQQAPPATVCVEVRGGAPQRAAVFDCAARFFGPAIVPCSTSPAFRSWVTKAAVSGMGGRAAAVRRRASCLF